MTACFFNPVKVAGNERRDELGKTTYGNTGTKRPHPHRGNDFGVKTGSADQPITCAHDGVVVANENNPALGWTVIVRLVCDDPRHKGWFQEYNHMIRQSPLKVGDKVAGNKDLIGNIGATGSALSGSGANHLHTSVASGALAKVPHNAPVADLHDLFKLIDESTAERKIIIDAARAAKG